MKHAVTILDAVDDEHLFAPWFRDAATWQAWRAFLAALFALPMTPEQLATYHRCTGRSAPPTRRRPRRGWSVVAVPARSFVLALIAVYLAAFHDCRQHLAPGERGTVMVIADGPQAGARHHCATCAGC